MDALKGKDNRGRADAAWVLGYLAAQDAALKEGVQQALTPQAHGNAPERCRRHRRAGAA